VDPTFGVLHQQSLTNANDRFSFAAVSSEVPTLGLLAGPAIGTSQGEATTDPHGSTLRIGGGGYRAALFHLGALTRLNELGLLSQVDTVGAVGGGSILAALLAARVPWPLNGPFAEWAEAVAAPMREIAASGQIIGRAGDPTQTERYARELAASMGAALPERPRFVFGGAGLALGKMVGEEEAGAPEGVSWRIGDAVGWQGYDAALVEDVIAAVRTELDIFDVGEQAVLENHGYLLVDAALRKRELAPAGQPTPPFPNWMDEAKVRVALAASSRRSRRGRLRHRGGRP
jgi:patatin-like phospholipase